MHRAALFGLTVFYLALGPGPALAHPGDHSTFTLATLLGHLLEPDHLAFIALIIVAGIVAFRAGRRTEVCEREKSKP